MESEFNLSEKIENWIKKCDVDNRKVCFEFLDSDAIELENILKEFIKRLKENLKIIQIQHNKGHSIRNIYKNTVLEIDNLAGKLLI